MFARQEGEFFMIRTLLAAGTTAAIAGFAYRAWKSGRLETAIDRFFAAPDQPYALAHANDPANVSRPAPAHPWPVDPLSLPKGTELG
jgi:hypothetical protein